VAYGRHDLLCIEYILDEFKRLRLDPQQIRIYLTAWQDDGIVVLRRHLIEDLVDLHRSTPILFVPTPYLTRRQRNDIDGRASLLQAIPRHLKFRLLKAVGSQNCDFFAI
jgi:hypothetical protein